MVFTEELQMTWIEKYLGTSQPDSEDLKQFEKIKERNRIDFKSLFNDNCLEDVVAMANSGGGILCIGFSDSGEVLGINTKDTSESMIRQKIRDLIEPELTERVDILEIGVKDMQSVYLIDIPLNKEIYALKPKSKNTQGKNVYTYFIRKGASTEQITPHIMNRLLWIYNDYWYNLNYRNALRATLDNNAEAIAKLVNIEAEFREKYLINGNRKEEQIKMNNTMMNLPACTVTSKINECIDSYLSSLKEINKNIAHKKLSQEEEQALSDLMGSLRTSDFDIVSSFCANLSKQENADFYKFEPIYRRYLRQFMKRDDIRMSKLNEEVSMYMREEGYWKKSVKKTINGFNKILEEVIDKYSENLLCILEETMKLSSKIREEIEIFEIQ